MSGMFVAYFLGGGETVSLFIWVGLFVCFVFVLQLVS